MNRRVYDAKNKNTNSRTAQNLVQLMFTHRFIIV